MASDAQISANQRNSLLSTGPRTERGRRISSQNARKHGMRAAREKAMLEAGLTYEERRRKWVAGLDPRNDREEFLANQQFVMAHEIERIGEVLAERVTSKVQNDDAKQIEDVHVLKKRLYFDRSGATALWGMASRMAGKQKTSYCGEAVDPHDPGLLVSKLESSRVGCQFLLDEWTALKERLEGSSFWQSIDRFKAVRLLGLQPVEATHQRPIAEIFMASHGLEPVRKGSRHHSSDPDEKGPFDDLRNEVDRETLAIIPETVNARWPDLVSPSDKAQCRQVLLKLVDENLEGVNAILEKYVEKAKADTGQDLKGLESEPDREADNLRRYSLRCSSTYKRFADLYRQAVKERGGEERTAYREPTRDQRVDVPYGDIAWAKTIDPSDARACAGLVPKRCVDDLGGEWPVTGGGPGGDDCGEAFGTHQSAHAACGGAAGEEGGERHTECACYTGPPA